MVLDGKGTSSMKKYVLDKLMLLVVKDEVYDEKTLIEIRYGLEAIFISFTRLATFMIINALIGNFLIGLIYAGFFVILKSFSYGFHAKTSFQCWILSALSYIGLPWLANFIHFNEVTIFLLIPFFFITFLLWSPADTYKRPLVNIKKRRVLKIISLIIIIIYSNIIIFVPSLSTIIILGILNQLFFINPLTYFIFQSPYKNYMRYDLERSDNNG